MMKVRELHRGERIGWLRAAVLGANDGVLSTASLIVGVAAADVAPTSCGWRLGLTAPGDSPVSPPT